MKHIKVICDTGATWTTAINGTPESIRKYYIGQPFVSEDALGYETVDTPVNVEFLEEN